MGEGVSHTSLPAETDANAERRWSAETDVNAERRRITEELFVVFDLPLLDEVVDDLQQAIMMCV